MMRTICIVVPLLLLQLVLCEQVIDLTTNVFIHYTALMHWSDAQAYCREHHTDLVTITSEKENQKFLSGRGWIGLKRDDSNGPWKWSRTNKTANFIMWDTDEPNYNCAFKFNNRLKWITYRCESLHTFMCYDEIHLVKENKTWEEALNYCRALDAVDPSKPATDYNNNGFDLVSVITQEDYSNIGKKILNATTDEVWMGLRYLAGQWVWVGGEKAQYDGIQSCPAQEFCGILVKNGTKPYKTRNCQLEMNFVCYKKPSPTGGN